MAKINIRANNILSWCLWVLSLTAAVNGCQVAHSSQSNEDLIQFERRHDADLRKAAQLTHAEQYADAATIIVSIIREIETAPEKYPHLLLVFRTSCIGFELQ
jgi:hypothetical protein